MSQDSKNLFADWLRFKSFGDPMLEKLIGCCQEWANAFRAKDKPRWLTLCGRSGVGKTHCAKRLWDWANASSDWTRTEYIPWVVYWPAFVKELRDPESPAKRQERDMQRWPVLFLDDVGADRDATGFATEALNTLLGCRSDKWTLITTNLTIEQIIERDRRLASRLVRPPNICADIVTIDYAERG